MTDFRIPTRVRLAPGCRRGLVSVARELGAERVLLVTDPGLAKSDLVADCLQDLATGDLASELFDAVPQNPRTTTAEAIAARTRPRDVVVALGGGSVIDAAKAGAMLATNGGAVRDWLGVFEFPSQPLPLIAIPTTCGTGSEVTWVSVLSDEERRVKISVKGPRMFPTVALVDAETLRGLPPGLVATTGMDALTHALEATTGSARNPVSDALAEKSIALTLEYLARAVQRGAKDMEALEGVMRASTLAGLAFGNADVAGVHCLSESLGGLYDVPHGLANALLLLPVMRSHANAVTERMTELGVMIGADSGLKFLSRVEAMSNDLGLPGIESLRIEPTDHELIARMAVENGSNSSNPRQMRVDDYLEVLTSL